MSYLATSWAFQQVGISSTAKLVLIFLADCHNHKSDLCFPSRALLAEKCCCDERTITRSIQELALAGLISYESRVGDSGRRTSNIYNLLITKGQSVYNPTDNLSGHELGTNNYTNPSDLEDDPLISIFATPEEPPENNPKAFWDQAVGMLQALHVSPKTINPFIGRCLKMADQDQERVLDAIQAAVDAEPHDAVPYIVAILGGKKERKTARFEKTAKQKEIEDAFAKLEAASERRKAQWAADLGEDYTGTGGGEDLPIVQHQPPSESISISGKRSEGVREVPRRSPAQVSRPRKGYLNESEVSAHDF
jgi:hypothetical protein